ncbi:metallo-beta-lactamase superfamily protein [Rutstroemia sp. NJR-2017a WRK4]|nr:metallo-beta-lactamase superfamily protein [Rutstroemia sp. NJR-2017a WRK4]
MSSQPQFPISLDSLVKTPPLLNLGAMEVDIGHMVRGAGGSSHSNPNPTNERRELVMISILISHPTEGLILYETGCGHDYPRVWGAPLNDLFNRVDFSLEHEYNSIHAAERGISKHTDSINRLPAAIAATGNDIKDVKAVIMGHLHLDHAGGLENFKGTDVPIYVHEIELKHAYHTIATKTDPGVYLPHYLTFDLNWQTWSSLTWEFTTGITLHLTPGHTPGLAIMQVNLLESGTWVFTSDMYHVRENWEEAIPQGFVGWALGRGEGFDVEEMGYARDDWLLRDHNDWIQSHQRVKSLVKRTNAKIILGHDKEYFLKHWKASAEYYA